MESSSSSFLLMDIRWVFGVEIDMALGVREDGNRIPVDGGGSLMGDGNWRGRDEVSELAFITLESFDLLFVGALPWWFLNLYTRGFKEK